MALSKCIYPLEAEKHASDMLVNIHSGEESADCVNVNEALRIGSNLLSDFQESLPGGFRKPFSSKVLKNNSATIMSLIQTSYFHELLIYSAHTK